MDAGAARQVVQLLRVNCLRGVILGHGGGVLRNEGRLLRLSKDVPVDDVTMGLSKDEEIVGKGNRRNHINCVVRSESNHKQKLHKHRSESKVAPIEPSDFVEL